MRKMTRAFVHLAVLTATASAIVGQGGLFPFGTSPAQAGEYYTRKRVNGVWITGHFRRNSFKQAAADKADAPAVPAKTAEPLPEQQAAAPPEEGDYTLRLRQSLEARAKAMLGDSAAVLAPLVKSVTLDFETGVRTTVYTDGSIREDAFDKLVTGAIPIGP